MSSDRPVVDQPAGLLTADARNKLNHPAEHRPEYVKGQDNRTTAGHPALPNAEPRRPLTGRTTPDPEYVRGLENLNTTEAAVYTRYSESTLTKLRHFGGGPVYIKLSARKIVYRRADLDAWMAGRAFASTSAASVGIVSEVAA